MKLADSLNPATQAENIKKLNAGLEAVDAKTLPGTSTATTGQILKLTGENKTPAWGDEYSYTPPAYSETEVNTGQKWINGKEIYSICYNGQFGTIETSGNIEIGNAPVFDKIINVVAFKATSAKVYQASTYTALQSGSSISLSSISPTFSNGYYNMLVYYTKPDPAPETRDDVITPGDIARADGRNYITPEDIDKAMDLKKTRKKTTK